MHMPPKNTTQKLINSTKAKKNAFELAVKRLRELGGDHAIAAGLSGGVDSSLTAAILVEAGWEVEGVTLWLMEGQGSCCSEGLIDAAGICKQLGIRHHVIDSRSNFKKQIIEQLVQGYEAGITPSPCSRCNRYMKFSEILEWARENHSINRIATGHYARIRYSNEFFYDENLPAKGTNRTKLLRGKDKNKDQSYFLYDLSQDLLNKVVFPLGELTKEETRNQALKYGLRTAQKAESQDLCLAEHYGSMKKFLDKYIKPKEGEIVLQDGTILGKHDGIEHFTIGQRKGLGISWPEPLYVAKIDSLNNQVIVASKQDSGTSSCIVGEVNWISIPEPDRSIEVEVQVRYRSNPVIAELVPIKATAKDIKNNRPSRCRIYFSESQFSISPGQAAVFYSGDLVLGGGLIAKE